MIHTAEQSSLTVVGQGIGPAQQAVDINAGYDHDCVWSDGSTVIAAVWGDGCLHHGIVGSYCMNEATKMWAIFWSTPRGRSRASMSMPTGRKTIAPESIREHPGRKGAGLQAGLHIILVGHAGEGVQQGEGGLLLVVHEVLLQSNASRA